MAMLLTSFFIVGVIFYVGFRIAAIKSQLDFINDTLKQKEIKSSDYLKEVERITKNAKSIDITSSINSSLASQLLSGEVSRNKDSKT